MNDNLIFKQLSSLEKVFLNSDDTKFAEITGMTALKGERVSYQILYKGVKEKRTNVKLEVDANAALSVNIRMVGNVPCALPVARDCSDEYYLSKEPGLFPDVLYPMKNNSFEVLSESCHALFVTVTVPEDIEAGNYSVRMTFSSGEEEYIKVFKLHILNKSLPEQDIIYTQWFHADCIADVYKLGIFSEQHWEMIEKFIKMAAYIGINMLLTPLFTLPLDTEVGVERPTLQLVDVILKDGKYSFGFKRLKRWIEICRRNGISRFEMSHLFTQWGTGFTPKIEAETEHGREKIFGWHIKANSEEYRAFLNEFLPALIEFLKSENVYENTYFHVSDEPDFERDYDCYKAERELLDGYVPEDKIMDAISDYAFCENGLIKKPVVITSSVDSFFEKGFKNIWAYYCCGPADKGYGNRFIAMPSGRNRICGVQLYKYGINGFLQWGYNFYYSMLSKRLINPFLVTDADEAFPSGDAFSVYPGEDGPIESIRSVVFYEALQDFRACKLLEHYIGKDAVDAVIEESGTITFNEFPRTDAGVANIRERINNKIEEFVG